MLIRVIGNEGQKRTRRDARIRVIKMEFRNYTNSVMLIPAQVIRTTRQRVFRHRIALDVGDDY